MITGFSHITLAVTNVERSFRFYCDLLGFRPLCLWEKGAYFLVGDMWFCLNVDQTYQPSHHYTHYAFAISESDFAIMKQKLIDAGVIEFQTNKSPGQSFYFFDPDGHKLEIHVGTWQNRLEILKHKSDIEFFI